MAQSMNPRLLAWLALLAVSSVAFTLGFACATPLAAFGAAAALTLSRGRALGFTAAVWLASQVVGFAALGYAWTADCLIWGAVLLAAALAGAEAARAVAGRLEASGALVAAPAAFAAAFLVYEAILFTAALAALSGIEEFTAPILLRVLAINVAAFAALLAANAVAARSGIVVRPAAGLAPRHA